MGINRAEFDTGPQCAHESVFLCRLACGSLFCISIRFPPGFWIDVTASKAVDAEGKPVEGSIKDPTFWKTVSTRKVPYCVSVNALSSHGGSMSRCDEEIGSPPAHWRWSPGFVIALSKFCNHFRISRDSREVRLSTGFKTHPALKFICGILGKAEIC